MCFSQRIGAAVRVGMHHYRALMESPGLLEVLADAVRSWRDSSLLPATHDPARLGGQKADGREFLALWAARLPRHAFKEALIAGFSYAFRVTQAPRLHRYTFNDYLPMEASSTVRHEFLAGEIYAMAGGTPQHAALAASMTAALISALRGGPCRVHSSDLRVRVTETGLATYPDVTVVCGPYQSDPEDRNTIVNPRVVVEITSDSTEHYDRSEKLASYQSILTVSAIVLVSHRERLIEVFERQSDASWKRTEARREGRITIQSLGCELVTDEIYDTASPA